MNTSLQVFDDFAPAPEEIRSKALAAGFKDQEYLGDVYPNIGVDYQPVHLFAGIQVALGCKIVPAMSFFRLDLKDSKLKTCVHADNICSEFAGLFYLNPPGADQSGTAFWTHKPTGWHAMPDEDQIAKEGRNVADVTEMMKRDWLEPKPWAMNGLVSMRFNRFITYPTKLFHSRFPWRAFGNGPEDGRLIWVCFYDLA